MPGLARILTIASLLAALPMSAGCGTTRITPPADPREAAPVFVLDHGRHTSLVLADPAGGLHRYAYGDWRFYAERETGPGSALAAPLRPTQGALGYRRLPGPATAATIRAEVRVGIVELHSLRVERFRAEALRARREAIGKSLRDHLVLLPADAVRHVATSHGLDARGQRAPTADDYAGAAQWLQGRITATKPGGNGHGHERLMASYKAGGRPMSRYGKSGQANAIAPWSWCRCG